MIVAEVKFYGCKLKPQTLCFSPAMPPRVGEIVRLEKGIWRVREVRHLFKHYSNMPGALQDQRYFLDGCGLQITLEQAPGSRSR
jgi:hypothetical protein